MYGPRHVTTPVVVFASLVMLIACSTDAPTSSRAPREPLVVPEREIDLALTGPQPLTESEALAINDSGTAVGWGWTGGSGGDPRSALVWRPPAYHWESLPFPAGFEGPPPATPQANAISNDGIAGGHVCREGTVDTSSTRTVCYPVIWLDGQAEVLPGGEGDVLGICPCDGRVLVGYIIVDGVSHGAIWIHGLLFDIGVPATFRSAELVAIDEGDQLVGDAYTTDRPVAGSGSPFRWSSATGWVALQGDGPVHNVNTLRSAIGDNGTFWLRGAITSTEIGGFETVAINDSGVVVGTIAADNRPASAVAAIWQASTGWLELPSTAINPKPTDVNNRGQVVGIDTHRGPFALLWSTTM